MKTVEGDQRAADRGEGTPRPTPCAMSQLAMAGAFVAIVTTTPSKPTSKRIVVRSGVHRRIFAGRRAACR